MSCVNGTCTSKVQVCTPNQTVCNGSEIQECDAHGQAFTVVHDCSKTNQDCVAGKCRTLVWADEFDGPDIDRSVWGNETGFVRNNELQNYTTDAANQYIDNGELVIKAIWVGGSGQGAYTSASLTTQTHKAFQYGRIGARIKVPAATGSWPGFWLLPLNAPWLSGGDIHVMEWAREWSSLVRGAADYTVNGAVQSPFGAVNLGRVVSDDYHVFAIEWTDTTIDWYVDAYNYFSWNYSTASPPPDGNPFQGQFYLILNYAIGGDSIVPPDSSQYPSEMRVDWVRVWQ